MIFYQLGRPLAYLRIKHPAKWKVDWLLPILLGVAAGIAHYFTRGTINVFGSGGIVALVLGFVQNLPGFYIAALAAIATFGRTDIDEIMPGHPPPRLETVTVNGGVNLIELTRRRFLCLLFAFLTVECVFLTLGSILAMTVAPAAAPWFQNFPNVLRLASATTLFFYVLVLSQLVIATLWGLYYLGERLHQPD